MTKNELEIPKDGSVTIWPFQDRVVIIVFNKRGQRRFTIKLSPEQASAISEELKKTSSFVRAELLRRENQ